MIEVNLCKVLILMIFLISDLFYVDIDQNEYKMIHLFHFYKLPLVILIPM